MHRKPSPANPHHCANAQVRRMQNISDRLEEGDPRVSTFLQQLILKRPRDYSQETKPSPQPSTVPAIVAVAINWFDLGSIRLLTTFALQRFNQGKQITLA